MIKFSSRMNLLKGSAIRELLALANKPEVLSFAGGMPAPELFPVDKIKAATDAVLEEQGRVALQYSSTNGFEHFRQQIADRMEAKLNIKTSADNILVTPALSRVWITRLAFSATRATSSSSRARPTSARLTHSRHVSPTSSLSPPTATA